MDAFLLDVCIFSMMKILSINVGRPKEKEWQGKTVLTSIFKSAVTDRRKVSFMNIEGDEQADLRVHGGINKAVYAYDIEHYRHWKKILQRNDWSYGLFGENLTTEGLKEDRVRIGSVYEMGTARLQVIQPRFPCLKLNLRFGSPDMVQQFIGQKRFGIYFKVIEEGYIQVNDDITLVEKSQHEVTIKDFAECYFSKGQERSMLEKILAIPYLPESKRQAFESFL